MDGEDGLSPGREKDVAIEVDGRKAEVEGEDDCMPYSFDDQSRWAVCQARSKSSPDEPSFLKARQVKFDATRTDQLS